MNDDTPVRISIIVAAYNVENFIASALLSLLDQSTPFHEVIVVDDASTDKTPDIIADIAADDAQLIVITNPTNIGLGPVRNVGMDAATGDYICFLDGDDLMLPGAVAKMERMLAGRPDLAIFNHTRLYDYGVASLNVATPLLAHGTHRSVAERKALFANLNVAWNKLYARSFLDRTGLRFPAGKYEDIGWNFLSLIQANEIRTSPDPLVHYRQRDGSILRARNLTHFDLFDRWDELFAALKQNPDLERSYGAMLRIQRFKSLRTVLDSPFRLPGLAKLKFARRIVRVCGPIRALPAREIGQAEQLMDLPGGFILRQLLNVAPLLALRNVVAGWRKAGLLGRLTPKQLVYRFVFQHLPVDPDLVIYQSYWGKKIACNPYAIYRHLVATRPELKHAWIVAPGADRRQTEGAEYLRQGSWRYYYLMARAQRLVTNANFPDAIIKRPGTIHLQTKHGTPLKHMGLDQLATDPSAFNDPKAFARRCARWDYVISSNHYSSTVWRRGFPYNYRMLETGYPRNDRLITADAGERAAIRARLGLPQTGEVVLYAPTFRPKYRPGAPAQPDKEAILGAILAGLKPGQTLAIRDHYFLDPGSTYENDPRLVDVSAEPSTTDVLLATDLLITDYSSIMFDFMVQDRPVVLLGHDLDLYRAARGVYFDISVQHPGVFCTDLPSLTAALADRQFDTDRALRMRADFRALFCHLDDGHAAARVCDVLFSTDDKGSN